MDILITILVFNSIILKIYLTIHLLKCGGPTVMNKNICCNVYKKVIFYHAWSI